MADVDRAYVSQYSQEDVGVSILVGSTPTDADGVVDVTLVNEDTGSVLLVRDATHVATGAYQITLTPDDTAILGNYRATWEYLLSGVQKTFNAYFAIGGAEPAYDKLDDGYKAIVDSVWIRMADMFDSPSGGPHLQTYVMTNFNRGRIAQLLRIAMGRLNTMAQPTSTYSLDAGGNVFPYAQWGPLLEQLTWIETIKHLRRSYSEMYDVEGGVGYSRFNRQSYYSRWGEMLQEEEANASDQLSIFKIQQMFLGRPAILVSGGAFGRYSSMNRPYMAARGRVWFANVW